VRERAKLLRDAAAVGGGSTRERRGGRGGARPGGGLGSGAGAWHEGVKLAARALS